MSDNEVIDISSDEEGGDNDTSSQRELFQPIVQGVVDALGGYEGTSYQMGDQALGCLKDLKKLWRRDETDDDRTIARIFFQTRVLPNDLIPIILLTAGQGFIEDKRAVLCVDLMTTMTWPIDVAEELKELDDELDAKADYTELLQSHLHYKAAVLKPGVLEALFGIALPPLTKSRTERTERDGQIVNVVLHLVRNLAFIKDLPANTFLSADHAEFSTMQSKFVRLLADSHILQLVLTIAANTDKDPLFDSWNTVVLEIIYLLFRGVKPTSIVMDQAKRPTDDLSRLLAQEERSKRQSLRQAATRHSRFGTTIAVKLNPNKKPPSDTDQSSTSASGPSRSFVVHRQEGITGDTSELWDKSKKQKAWKGHKIDELGSNETLTVEAMRVLQGLASEFLEECFNPFLSTLLKDIRSERAKITEKDNVRLLYVTKWFLEFFFERRTLVSNAMEKDKAKGTDREEYNFGLVAEVLERQWIIWVLKRMREAGDEKPKAWTELQAGIECLTQLLSLIDLMSSLVSTSTTPDPSQEELIEASTTLLQQLIYSGEVLDVAFESLRSYKEGTQSLAYLDSSVRMGYVLLKMLERWAKKGKGSGETYVRRKKAGKRKKKARGGDEVPEEEELEQEEDEDVIHETMFTFEAFEMKFAHADIAHTLLVYLSRYKEFTTSEQLRRVVGLLHRQAVKAKAEGLFFKVSSLFLFKSILADQKTFPQDQPHKDLVNLVNYILRQFFKAIEKDTFLAVEAFFPKNRGNWKQFSSWEPPSKSSSNSKTVEDNRFPQEVQVKKGYPWSDQVGIAITALVEKGQTELVLWTQEILETAKAERERVIEEVDNKDKDEDTQDKDGDGDDDDSMLKRSKLLGPSVDAQAKMVDYLIPYLSDEHAEAATKNPHLKLLFRLSKCYILDEDADELEWYVPAAILPAELHSIITVITQFLETPFSLEGKKASQLLSKKSRRRRRARAVDSDGEEAEGEQSRQRKERKKKEETEYKSAQFIEDSDVEYGNLDNFLEKEKQRREKTEKEAARLGEGKSGAMKATGTKKRRRKADDKDNRKGKGRDRKKRRGDPDAKDDEVAALITADESNHSSSSDDENRRVKDREASPYTDKSSSETATIIEKSRPRPRPKPVALDKSHQTTASKSPSNSVVHKGSDDAEDNSGMEVTEADVVASVTASTGTRRKGRLILSDEDDE